MAKQTHIKFISEGFEEILCSGGVQEAVTEAAETIQARANGNNTRGGEGFQTETWMGKFGGGRWVASVYTSDRKSCIAESEDKALSRAVSG